jgi:hypothetical protein
VGGSRRFFVGANSLVETGLAPSNSAEGDAASCVPTPNQMQWTGKIRCWHWRRVGFCTLLCLLVRGSAVAQTDASTPPTKLAQTSATPAPKAKPHTTTHTAAKHTTTHKSTAHTTAAHTTAKSRSARGKKVTKKRGQQAIDSERARQIQTALIREHYMQGEPSGTWDSTTQAAMQRYQADHGWQSKTTPDARALIKLGLGPSSDHLLNPESAMTTTTSNTPAAADPKAGTNPAPPENNIPQQ